MESSSPRVAVCRPGDEKKINSRSDEFCLILVWSGIVVRLLSYLPVLIPCQSLVSTSISSYASITICLDFRSALLHQ